MKYSVTIKYLLVPALPPKTVTVHAIDERTAIEGAKRKAAKEWDLSPVVTTLPIMEIIEIKKAEE